MHGLSNNTLRRLLVTAAFTLILSACGGGGGGGPVEPPPAPPPPGPPPPPPPPPVADVSPEAFSFSPAQIDNAEAGKAYTATTAITGFDGELTARVTDTVGNAEASLEISATEFAEETSISAGGTLTLRLTLGEENPAGSTASATITVGEGSDAESATFSVIVVDKQSPQVSVHFPTTRSVVEDETLTITGGWSDNENVERITSVSDGAEALLWPDNRWQMTVALSAGLNKFAFEAHDTAGNRSDTVNVEIVREAPFFDAPRGVVEVDGKLIVLSQGSSDRSIRHVDRETLENSIISSETIGNGPMWTSTFGPLATNANNTTVYLVDRGDSANQRVLAIDVATGNRTVLTEGLRDVRSIAAGPDGKLLVLGQSDEFNAVAVIAVDTAGNQEVISRPGTLDTQIGGGDTWGIGPTDLTFDETRTALYVSVGSFPAGVYSVDLGSGDRTRFSVNGDSKGPSFDEPENIDIDISSGNLYVTDSGGLFGELDKRPIFEVVTAGANPGERSVISNNDDLGIDLSRPVDIAAVRDEDGLRLLIADLDHDNSIISIEPSSGARTEVPGAAAAGNGELLDNADALAIDVTNGRLLLSDADNESVRGIDLATGDRSDPLFTPSAGTFINEIALDGDIARIATSGEIQGLGALPLVDINQSNAGVLSMLENTGELRFISSLHLEPGHAFVGTTAVGGIRRVVDIDLGSGNFTGVWNNDDGVIPGFNAGMAELLRIDETHLLAGTVEGLILASTSTPGDRRRFLDGDIASATAIAHDPTRKRVFAFDSGNNNLALIDVSDLDTPVVSLLFGEGTTLAVSTGYHISPTNLVNEMRYDAESQRLYLLSDGGTEVTVINVGEIRVDSNEDGIIDENDVNEDGTPTTRVSGEAVLLSRGIME